MPRAKKSKLYTRAGDTGLTSLFGGGRVPKDSARVEAYGAVDELNSALGVAVSFLQQRSLTKTLQGIQNELFNIGSELASEAGAAKAADFGRMFGDAAEKIVALEQLTDALDSGLPPLQTFVLPSGSQAGAMLHFCRTVCRRAERRVVSLGRLENVNPDIARYLNRLSDMLFAMARYVNHAEGAPETPWQQP